MEDQKENQFEVYESDIINDIGQAILILAVKQNPDETFLCESHIIIFRYDKKCSYFPYRIKFDREIKNVVSHYFPKEPLWDFIVSMAIEQLEMVVDQNLQRANPGIASSFDPLKLKKVNDGERKLLQMWLWDRCRKEIEIIARDSKINEIKTFLESFKRIPPVISDSELLKEQL